MKYCRRCILPDTRPNLRLDAEGVCNACRSHASRPDIDWKSRAADFKRLVENVRTKGKGYDCVIPVSGGKDSTWQVVTCLEAGMKPLAVTWRPPGRTAIGQANLENLVKLGVDHIDYSISPKVEVRFMVTPWCEGNTGIVAPRVGPGVREMSGLREARRCRSTQAVSPARVVVAAMEATMTSWLVNGRPRQFIVMWLNSRCSILFHFEVPGGKWHTVTSRPVSAARAASSAFHARAR